MVHFADGLPAQLNLTAIPLAWEMGKGLVVVFQSSPKMRSGILGLGRSPLSLLAVPIQYFRAPASNQQG
jgi:hypothetical protein